MEARQAAFRDLTGQFYTDILDDVQMLIDRGQGTIRLATDGHSIRVFVRRASDYLIGGAYDVPSGLGGTFRVILEDVCDTFAIVQNCGNCEDFDEMLPYRVPLDALIEIDDRRARAHAWAGSSTPTAASRSYADEKAEITRLCTFETDTRRTVLLKACKVGSTWYAAVKVSSLDGSPVEDATYVTDEDGSITFAAVFLTRYDDGCWGYKDMEESAGPSGVPRAGQPSRASLGAEGSRQLRPWLAPALPGLGGDPGLPGGRQDQTGRPGDLERRQHLPGRDGDPLPAGAPKAPVLPHRGHRRTGASVESLPGRIRTAQLREGRCEPSPGGVLLPAGVLKAYLI